MVSYSQLDTSSRVFIDHVLCFIASTGSAASELSSTVTSSRCQTPHAVTPVGLQVASPVTTPVTVPCSTTRPPTLTTCEFQPPMTFTSTPLRPTPAMQLQSVSTQQVTSAGTNSNHSSLI